MSLTVPELADRLDRLRPSVIEAKRREFPRLAVEDLKDAYSQAVEGILRTNPTFENDAQIAAYLHQAVTHLAINTIRSTARHGAPLDAGEIHLADPATVEPEDRALAMHARIVLWEFLAELAERDRTIAFLHLDPAHDYTPRQIARQLQVPYPEVRRSLRRSTIGLSRFAAQIARPGAFCQRRRVDVLRWRETGTLPLPLRIHLSHCHACRAQYAASVREARHAILPLLPAPAVPLGGAGLLTRVWNAAATHPAVQRVDDTVGKWRKVAPVGGGGGAAIVAKLATAGAVATVGAATAALHAITAQPHPHPMAQRPAHRHRPAHHHRSTHHLKIYHLTATQTVASAPVTPPVVTHTPVPKVTHTRHVRHTTPHKAASAHPTLPPPPDANPLPTRPRTTSTRSTGRVAAALATSTTSASTSTQTSNAGAGGGSRAAAYVPAPDQSTQAASSAAKSGHGGSTSSSPAAPGGPPPP